MTNYEKCNTFDDDKAIKDIEQKDVDDQNIFLGLNDSKYIETERNNHLRFKNATGVLKSKVILDFYFSFNKLYMYLYAN
jgi:hypothetical protein